MNVFSDRRLVCPRVRDIRRNAFCQKFNLKQETRLIPAIKRTSRPLRADIPETPLPLKGIECERPTGILTEARH